MIYVQGDYEIEIYGPFCLPSGLKNMLGPLIDFSNFKVRIFSGSLKEASYRSSAIYHNSVPDKKG